MSTFLIHRKVITAIVLIAFTAGTNSWAQKSALRGGSVVFDNGSNTVTLSPPSSGLTSYSLNLPTAQSATSTNQWLSNNGSGVLSWVTSPAGLDGLAIGFSAGVPQQTAVSPNYLFI